MRRPRPLLAPVPFAVVALSALALLGGPTPQGRAEDEDPLAAPVRAILLEDDVGLRKVYDGIRKGLELAQLPRVRLETVADTPEAFAAYAQRIEAAPPPLLFLVGRRACERAMAAGLGGPRVFVDTALAVAGVEHPAAVVPQGQAAVVRAVTPAERWGDVVRGLFPDAPDVAVALRASATDPASAAVAPRLAEAMKVRLAVGLANPQAVLSVRLGGPERSDAGSTPPAPPLLSDDVGRWGKGASVLLVPDHRLLGRTAAEAGRRLLAPDPPAGTLRLTVGVTQVRVDLDAARDAGLEVPLPFLAHADLLRGGQPR